MECVGNGLSIVDFLLHFRTDLRRRSECKDYETRLKHEKLKSGFPLGEEWGFIRYYSMVMKSESNKKTQKLRKIRGEKKIMPLTIHTTKGVDLLVDKLNIEKALDADRMRKHVKNSEDCMEIQSMQGRMFRHPRSGQWIWAWWHQGKRWPSGCANG